MTLRVIGAFGAGLTVLGVADLARTLSTGPLRDRAALWGAVCVGALLSTPYLWSFMVDGEQLAVPFVAWGLASYARGLSGVPRAHLWWSAAAGVLAVAAILTKQNFADVFVFVAALTGLRLLGRSLERGRAIRALLGFGAGVATALVLAAACVLAHGTSLSGVWYAMYMFRLDALTARGSGGISADRLATLGWAALLSGLAFVLVAVAVVGLLPGRRDAGVGSLLVLLAFDLVSVLTGTSYWLHYLIQPAIPAAAMVGILSSRRTRLELVAVACAVLSVFGIAMQLRAPPQTAEEQVGEAIGSSAAPNDEMVTVLGHAGVNLAAGLASPYPYLWVLPATELDPGGRHRAQGAAPRPRPAGVGGLVGARPLGPPRGAHRSAAGPVPHVREALRSHDLPAQRPRATGAAGQATGHRRRPGRGASPYALPAPLRSLP